MNCGETFRHSPHSISCDPGSYGVSANAWGLVDMHGNVFEWCSNNVDDKQKTVQDDNYVPVMRGGSFVSSVSECASLYRGVIDSYDRANPPRVPFVGCRLVLVPDELEAGEARTLYLRDPSRERTLELRFRYCPSGSFTMGENEALRRLIEEGAQKRENSELAIGRETITVGDGKIVVPFLPGFWILETEVSQAQWVAVMGKENNPSLHKGYDYPVENVSWEDCRAFVDKLNASGIAPLGFRFDLPSEAQWEYACRAGSADAFWWGNDPDPARIRCQKSVPSTRDSVQTFGPELLSDPIRSFGSNPWGLYHMNGNVSEFCSDNAFPNQGRESNSNGERIARGGFYILPSELCHYAYRLCVPNSPVKNKAPFVGFRLVLVPREATAP